MWTGWLIAVLGVWTAVTAFFGAGPVFYRWNDIIVGAVVALVGLFATKGRWAGVVAGIVGVWLFVAGFIPGLHANAGMWWDEIIVGVVIAILGFISETPSQQPLSHGPSHA